MTDFTDLLQGEKKNQKMPTVGSRIFLKKSMSYITSSTKICLVLINPACSQVIYFNLN